MKAKEMKSRMQNWGLALGFPKKKGAVWQKWCKATAGWEENSHGLSATGPWAAGIPWLTACAGSLWGPSLWWRRLRRAMHQQPCGSDPLGIMAGSRNRAGRLECPDECQREAVLSPCLLRGQRLLTALDKGCLLNFVLLLLLKLHINLVQYLVSF